MPAIASLDSTASPSSVVPPLPPELVYGTAEEFLHEQLLPTYVRSVTGKTAKWCIEWYFHPEAVSRVAALWRSWGTCASMLPRARASGGGITQTITWASC